MWTSKIRKEFVMKGKLIVIEGTDSSGKETQAKELVKRLKENGIKAIYETFPKYNTATGKIVGGPYLGKDIIIGDEFKREIEIDLRNEIPSITTEQLEKLSNIITDKAKLATSGWFKETAPNVDAKVASCYFGSDRRYNTPYIKQLLKEEYIVIMDRYVDSNLAHQGGKEIDANKRLKIYKDLEWFEYEFLELVKPDFTIFLHLPPMYSKLAIELRNEKPDQHESNIEHLKNAEIAYLELAKLHNYITVECVKENSKERKTKEELSNEIYPLVKKRL